MTNWDKAMDEYLTCGKVSKCPVCSGENVRVDVFSGPSRDSYTLVCNDCKKWAHYDGCIRIKRGKETNL